MKKAAKKVASTKKGQWLKVPPGMTAKQVLRKMQLKKLRLQRRAKASQKAGELKHKSQRALIRTRQRIKNAGSIKSRIKRSIKRAKRTVLKANKQADQAR